MDETYSSWTALLYIFNLIIGTGALTLPAAFFRSGWALGSVLICIMSFVSYVTATFMVEAMATCNALLNLSKLKQLRKISHYVTMNQRSREQADSEDEDWLTPSEDSPLTGPGSIQNFPNEPTTFYTIDNKVEMADMAGMLFNRSGRIAFFICLVLYLFGDLSIYAAAMGQSFIDALCSANNMTDPDARACSSDQPYSTLQTYRIILVGFLLLFGPLAFFNVQKTRYLQITTSVTRWLAFGLMIYLTIERLLNTSVPHNTPSKAVLSGFPSLLSSCVYAFMCHHSLPSILSPIRNKKHLHRNLLADYLLVLSFYLSLSIPAVFAFPHIKDLYTLNFVPTLGDRVELKLVEYFLILFPVMTLTASFPVVAVTLRNNLQATVPARCSRLISQGLLPLVAVVPPILLAILMPNLEFLVGITGSYAGVGVQYIIPAALVLVARHSRPDELVLHNNPYASPFHHIIWPFLIILWALISMTFVTIHHVRTHFG